MYLGGFAGYDLRGNSNTILGYAAGSGEVNLQGSNNVFLGRGSGSGNTGSNNVFLGYLSGDHNDFRNKSNQLIIANSITDKPLIYGNFNNKTLTINGKTSSNTVAPTLHIKGRGQGDDQGGHILHVENTFDSGNEAWCISS